ncbi:MAG: kinase/pyrophosphorylase [Candidatus Polarisedimenticolaceae bacterium]|nr:kinase/pyrophosphorylase [Candidatus Polarisedimenticolaceae bacterium]
MVRTVFFVSESTGITAEAIGQSMLSQFADVEFEKIYLPFVNTELKARDFLEQLVEIKAKDGVRPIVFATMADCEISKILRKGDCLYLEMFDTFSIILSEELGVEPVFKSGQSHGITDDYESRMNSIHYTMDNDDGMRMDKFDKADVILVGVSRSGKTPTCLYLAMHFGLKAANYPLTPDDFESGEMPAALKAQKHKLIGLTIEPKRLQQIREVRRSGSEYSSLKRCQEEVRMANTMFKKLRIKVLDTSEKSIEELASRIIKSL